MRRDVAHTGFQIASIIAVVGTDTGVGKTLAARALLDFFLARNLSARAIKPFVTGAVDGQWDDLMVLDPSGLNPPTARYNAPLSPYGAIRAGEREMNMEHVRSAIERSCANAAITIIEGIGGVMVPLNREKLWIDLHAQYQWPALIIARSGLGTINHTLLTIEALRARDVRIIGFILNETSKVNNIDKEAAAENACIISELSQVESLGIVDYDDREPLNAWKNCAAWARMEGLLVPAD